MYEIPEKRIEETYSRERTTNFVDHIRYSSFLSHNFQDMAAPQGNEIGSNSMAKQSRFCISLRWFVRSFVWGQHLIFDLYRNQVLLASQNHMFKGEKCLISFTNSCANILTSLVAILSLVGTNPHFL